MTLARSHLVSVADTPYYHVICRCVRRAFLCGHDPVSEQSFEHRRQWVVDRIGLLTQVFTIDILAYAIMSNHYHLVVHINAQQAIKLTDQHVVERWRRLFCVPTLVRQYSEGEPLSKADIKTAQAIIHTWRERLASLSWLMRCLNEEIARRANQEDHCTGRFWEGRFKSQALLDDQAVIQCMSYVDLNPIGLGMDVRVKLLRVKLLVCFISISPDTGALGSNYTLFFLTQFNASSTLCIINVN